MNDIQVAIYNQQQDIFVYTIYKQVLSFKSVHVSKLIRQFKSFFSHLLTANCFISTICIICMNFFHVLLKSLINVTCLNDTCLTLTQTYYLPCEISFSFFVCRSQLVCLSLSFIIYVLLQDILVDFFSNLWYNHKYNESNGLQFHQNSILYTGLALGSLKHSINDVVSRTVQCLNGFVLFLFCPNFSIAYQFFCLFQR